jgi:hypothetical protein
MSPKRKGRNDTIQIQRKTKIIIYITNNGLTSVLGDSVISSITGIVLGTVELLPIFPNQPVWRKEKMSEEPNIIIVFIKIIR